MRTVYLCGPITNGETAIPERVRRNIEQFGIVRRKFGPGTIVLGPDAIAKKALSWEESMKQVIPMLCESDLVVLLPGWEDSKGACFEIFIARTLNIPIVFSDHLPI